MRRRLLRLIINSNEQIGEVVLPEIPVEEDPIQVLNIQLPPTKEYVTADNGIFIGETSILLCKNFSSY